MKAHAPLAVRSTGIIAAGEEMRTHELLVVRIESLHGTGHVFNGIEY